MVFSGAVFLYAFLPLTLAVYALAPQRGRNAVLLIASLLFYAFGEPVYVFLLLLSSVSNWALSLCIERRRGTRTAKLALAVSVLLNLGLLGFFKYADFFLTTVNGLFGLSLPLTGVRLPLGISFYTFQTMSYTIDVYRGHVRPQRNLATFATFVCLFPQLIAGPIVRYSDIAPELRSRTHTLSDAAAGTRRFVLGLAKKILFANLLGELVSGFRASQEQSVLYFWLGAAAFTLQIYYDFSGYSDMAIGLGRILGFHFPENFRYPYCAGSITEFWRRWHISLGSWFRDYVYIPLGGSRTTRAKWIRNVAVVWLLTGLWHGAAWNFVLWGGYFGLLLLAERLWLGRLLARAPAAVQHALLLLLVTLGFVLFRAESLQACGQTLRAMFGGAPLWDADALYALRSFAGVLALGVVGATRLPKRLWKRLEPHPVSAALGPVLTGLLLLAATAALVDGSFNPFLYFRF